MTPKQAAADMREAAANAAFDYGAPKRLIEIIRSLPLERELCHAVLLRGRFTHLCKRTAKINGRCTQHAANASPEPQATVPEPDDWNEQDWRSEERATGAREALERALLIVADEISPGDRASDSIQARMRALIDINNGSGNHE